MGEDILSRFLNLMNSDLTDSDLELVQLGNSLGLDLAPYAKLRASQNNDFVEFIRDKALARMEINKENVLANNHSFYSGSIDFMVSDEPEGKKFFLLETNGGSHRGLSITTKKQQILLYNGYLESILYALKKNERKDKRVFVLIGVPVEDALIHEKVLMIDYYRNALKSKGLTIDLSNIENFSGVFNADINFLIADYRQLSNTLSFSDNWIKYNGNEVSVLIGDGSARRLKNLDFETQIKRDFLKIRTIIVNPIYKVTDDKSLTYLASFYCKELLQKYKLKYLTFTKAFNEKDLIKKLNFLTTKYDKSFIIKPNGGSGGAGVMPVSKDNIKADVKAIIEESKNEFFAKFMKTRDPFPYTIQEKANFSLIDWKEGKHTFDLRIYLAQYKGLVIPIGGLGRIARGNYIKGLDKQEFVVNLSGYDGQVEVERGIGFSKETCKLLNLEEEDFINMFCIGSILFANIVKDYNKIVNFSNWDKNFR
ncbi:MAG: hypothetical protein ACXADU_13420 [Promethearchaeota archaeon]